MGCEPKRQQHSAGGEGLPAGGETAGIGTASSESAVVALLDPAAGTDVRALQAVLCVSRAVLGAQHFDDALEAIAEQSLVALDAASFSISRWERERGVLHTLINVGELGPGEQRWPQDEEYQLAHYSDVTEHLRHGRPYVSSIDSEDADPVTASLLHRLNKESALAVPVMCESSMWGELWATGSRARRFSSRDVRLLEAIAAQVSVAIGRAELFSEVSRYAYEDALTGLANRRGLDERLRALQDGEHAPTLLICDLDGLKEINDRDGHPAGDALLRGVAGALSDAASAVQASLVARVGGDEFCVVLATSRLAEAEEFARSASRRIARELGPDVSLCWGAAVHDPGTTTAQQLIAAADAALIDAKRLGLGRLWLRSPGEAGLPPGRNRRRGSACSDRRSSGDLVPRFVELVDQRQPPSTLAALELLACELAHTLDAAAWCISTTTDDLTAIRTVRGIDTELDQSSGLRVVQPAEEEAYRITDFPASAQVLASGGAFVAAVDLDDSDPAEVALLNELGYRAVLGVGVVAAQQSYLLEIYSDGEHRELAAFAPHARVLAHYCVQAGPPPARSQEGG